jgi:surfeit locus 1 family protein
MSRSRLLWPTLITVSGVAFLIFLGSWQVERLSWKQDLIDARSTALAADPVALPAAQMLEPAFDLRRVSMRGRFLHDREMYVLNRTHNSVAGVHVITPLKRLSADGGGMVLVNRGWVPQERTRPATRDEGLPTGEVEVIGIVRIGITARSSFTPANDPANGIWFAPDPEAMSRSVGAEATNFVIEAGPGDNPHTLPVGGQTVIKLTNNHLSYALTWYGLALALCVIYLVYLRNRKSP